MRSDDIRGQVSLPGRPFFYSMEQISALLEVDPSYLKDQLVYFDRRTPGIHKKDTLKAINIAPIDKTPVWRISEAELVRWMKFKNIKYHERGWLA